MRDEVIAYLRERELVTNAYLERSLMPARLADGRQVNVLTYVVDRKHPQYAGRMHREEAAQRGLRDGSGNPARTRSMSSTPSSI